MTITDEQLRVAIEERRRDADLVPDKTTIIEADHMNVDIADLLGDDANPPPVAVFVPVRDGDGARRLTKIEGELTKKRAREILRLLSQTDEDEVRAIYLEVLGATFGGRVTVERARESIGEALEEWFISLRDSKKREEGTKTPSYVGGDMSTEEAKPPSTTDVADLVGDAPRETQSPTTAPEEKEMDTATAKKRTPRKPKPEKKLTILLRDPEIKRDKDGKIVHIVGTCTWKEGGKYACTKTRKIHAADAFQVRYCDEHKIAARKVRATKK